MTSYEASARTRKAHKIADVLVAHGATACQAAGLPEAGRQMAATLAGTRNPSATTWSWVVDELRTRESASARMAA